MLKLHHVSELLIRNIYQMISCK